MYKKLEDVLNHLYQIITFYYCWIEGNTHRKMTYENTSNCIHATFKDAVDAFNERYWNYDRKYGVLSGKDNDLDDYIHASIVKFSGVGYILNDFAWHRFDKYINNRIKYRKYSISYIHRDWVEDLANWLENIKFSDFNKLFIKLFGK